MYLFFYFMTEQKMYAFENKFHEKSRLPIQQDESKKVHSLFTRSEEKLKAYTQDLEKSQWPIKKTFKKSRWPLLCPARYIFHNF